MSQQHPDPLADLPPEDSDVGMGAADPHPALDDDLELDDLDEDEAPVEPLTAPHLEADEAITPLREPGTGGGGGGSW